MIYESKEPDILSRLEGLGGRLRAIVDDHAEQAHDTSAESISSPDCLRPARRESACTSAASSTTRCFIVRRNGQAIRALCGSTNFSLRGLYIQANNTLVFEEPTVAAKSPRCSTPIGRRKEVPAERALEAVVGGARPAGSRVQLCFSPHSDSALSLGPIAAAIESAESSVLYSVVFLNQITGSVHDALEELMHRSLFSYGVAQRVGGLTVQKPDGSRGLLPFAYLGENAPIRSRRNGMATRRRHSNMVHHKFLVTDFNGAHPTVFTGSSNMAQGGEEDNGDHMIRIEDRKVAIAYAIEALRLFDHFHFRVNAQAPDALTELRLGRPPAPGKKPWFASYYRIGHLKARDRSLFVN